MNRDDIIRMAQEAGYVYHVSGGTGTYVQFYWDQLEHFAHLVAAAEREACAVIAFNAKTYLEAAAAIRARREQ